MVDTSTVTLHELDKMVLNMGQHVNKVLAKEHSSSSSIFVYVKCKKETDYKLDNMTGQLETLSANMLSSESLIGSMYGLGSR